MQTQQIQTKRKWAQPPWTSERRAKHRAGCQRAAEEHRKMDREMNFVHENREMLLMLFRLKEKFRIDPKEALRFILLVQKKRKLSDNEILQWRSMASQQIPAAEIYQRMFTATA